MKKIFILNGGQHFAHSVEKNATPERIQDYRQRYIAHLEKHIPAGDVQVAI